ncbi:outer kinetochore KNL1 complex subunit ZWINT isoform X5 [Patagioenas fasciata]|uniref:outer kinetochore KNL1 complex subunit ZWINT isoform X5 n=1 Tax=Patagioenas fasciata TaxID=372321 RepID=UPI003A995217
MAGPLERARGLLGALEAALSPPGEDGDVPPQVLVEHLLDRRRKRKLLLTQLRVLQRLLQVLQCPDTPPALPDLRAAQAQARNSWRELKLGYGGALETLGGALPPTLARMGEGRRLQRRLQEAVTKHLQAQLHEALERRQQASGCRCSSGWRSCGGSGTASRGRCRGCGGRSSDAVGGWAAGAARTTPPAGGTAQGLRCLKDHENLQLIGRECNKEGAEPGRLGPLKWGIGQISSIKAIKR